MTASMTMSTRLAKFTDLHLTFRAELPSLLRSNSSFIQTIMSFAGFLRPKPQSLLLVFGPASYRRTKRPLVLPNSARISIPAWQRSFGTRQLRATRELVRSKH